MAKFPVTEDKIARLAKKAASGLKAKQKTFPTPPVAPEELRKTLKEFVAQ